MSSDSDHCSKQFSCLNCRFSSSSQAGLSVHRTKRHWVKDLSVQSVSVVRSYPEGKKFYCCICENIIVNFPNFKRHFQSVHPTTLLVATGHCSVCKLDFPNAQAVSVHCRRQHGISKKKSSKFRQPSPSSSPIRSEINLVSQGLPNVSQPPAEVTLSQSNCDSSPPPTLRRSTRFRPSNYIEEGPSSPPSDPGSPSPSTPALSNDDSAFIVPSPLSPLPPISQFSQQYQASTETLPPVSPDSIPLPPITQFIPPASPLTDPLITNPTNPTNIVDPPVIPSNSSAGVVDFQNRWSSVFSADSFWQDFSSKCSDFADDVLKTSVLSSKKSRPTPRRPDRPVARAPSNNRRHLEFNPILARRIQSIYRISKKRAARQILNNNSPSFTGTADEANAFFTKVFDNKDCNPELIKQKLEECVPTGPTDDSLTANPTPAEITKKLRSLSNSAPGADKVEYRHLKAVDPKGEILSLIYARCLSECDVPASWKTSTTVLIHKKGSSDDVSNFRPIALMSCIYKLLMSILANRLVSYSISNDLMSPSQKSARPSEGCYEHTFILQSLVADAQRLNRNLCLSWLDLRNAFGSVPHGVIATTLSHIGIPQSIIDLIGNVYTNASTEVRTPAGTTPPIPILAGVKQGCPLSPILFNLSIELIIRSVTAKAESLRSGPAKHHGAPISVLAYADDLVIISRKSDDLQDLLDAASSSATLLGLEFRQDKCASLSLTKSNVAAIDYLVQGKTIPALLQHEHYRYLGIPIGVIRDVSDLHTLVDHLCNDLDKINSSLLAPWQKLDAIRTFIQPCLTYVLRAGNPLKRSLINYRKKLIEVVRSTCNLPLRATTHFIFASRNVGGLAFHDPLAEVDVQVIVQALKMLSSSDIFVSHIAKAELLQSVRFAAQDNPSPSLIYEFLSGSTCGNFHPNKIRYRKQSIWTRARSSCRRQKVSFSVPDNGAPSIASLDRGPILAKSCCSFLHHLVQSHAAEKLTSLPDQGKVARALVADRFYNGSSWVYTGLNISFKDWRFIHRARLNVVPTNQNKSRWSNVSTSCRKCGSEAETLPHIICHCRQHMTEIRDRHNRIVDRLSNAIRSGEVRLDQQIPDIPDRSRPDIVIIDDNQVTIIDVTCPFENDSDALKIAEQEKIAKYDHLKDHYIAQGKNCSVFGFVIGSLGAWHPANEAVLTRLGMTRSYKSLFRKLCCSDAIQGSAITYYNHMSVEGHN